MSAARAVVVGLGSIGTRHAQVLAGIGLSVTTISRRPGGDFPSIRPAIAATRPDYAVIATETAHHLAALEELAASGFHGVVLVEKPLLAHRQSLPDHGFARVVVGYNLRFHPVMTALAERLNGRPAITVSAYVGQDIRQWRPGRDHRATASSTAKAGGGVLRDLSHELDYLLWLFGPWQRVAALGGTSGARQLEVDDHISLLMEMTRCSAVQVHMDYLDRAGIRKIRLNLAEETIEADLVTGSLAIDGVTTMYPHERNDSFTAMHRAALSDAAPACSLSEGLAVVDLIEASERALTAKTWIAA